MKTKENLVGEPDRDKSTWPKPNKAPSGENRPADSNTLIQLFHDRFGLFFVRPEHVPMVKGVKKFV